MPALLDCLAKKFDLLILVKPQFEAKREQVGVGGIVKEARTHCQVLNDFCQNLTNFPLHVRGLTFSPIRGAKGNLEFWFYVANYGIVMDNLSTVIENIVKEAHRQLLK